MSKPIIFPVGYSCTATPGSLGEGNSLLNEIREGGDRPTFCVSLKTGAGETIVSPFYFTGLSPCKHALPAHSSFCFSAQHMIGKCATLEKSSCRPSGL